MKNITCLFVALCMSAGLSAQQEVVKVQGHPHPVLTQLKAEGKYQEPIRTRASLGEIDPEEITCWIGNPSSSLPIDTAYLMVKWTDGKRDRDSLLVWGYRWNTVNSYETPVTVHTIDMIRAVANADPRFSVLLQYTGATGYSVGGFGYNYEGCSRVPLAFDYNGASTSSVVGFSYTGSPNTSVGQVAIPPSPQRQAELAISAANGTEGSTGTGVADHPFNIFYGYPAYDYDWWVLQTPENKDQEWLAGWNTNGYWSYFTGTDKQVPTNYAEESISFETVTNQSTHGFVFALDFNWNVDMSGRITYVTCPCSVDEETTATMIMKETDPSLVSYKDNTLYLSGLEGYDCTVVNMNGQAVASFRVNSPESTRLLPLPSGVYILSAQNQTERKTYKWRN
ncbi:MAG: T9SS type A sorting domain-containing protein [Tannerellaceae bacterium]|nr:T9SS type A sorting domain-containing protein [Tannerellaceae bacterium]